MGCPSTRRRLQGGSIRFRRVKRKKTRIPDQNRSFNFQVKISFYVLPERITRKCEQPRRPYTPRQKRGTFLWETSQVCRAERDKPVIQHNGYIAAAVAADRKMRLLLWRFSPFLSLFLTLSLSLSLLPSHSCFSRRPDRVNKNIRYD